MTYQEAIAGQSRSNIAKAVHRGSLRKVRRGVYERGACETVRTAAAHGGSVACVSAAVHHGLWVPEHGGNLHIALGAHARAYAHDECTCVVHWSDEDGKTSAFGVPSVRATVRQVLRCQGIEAFFVALESALRQGKLSISDVQWLRRTPMPRPEKRSPSPAATPTAGSNRCCDGAYDPTACRSGRSSRSSPSVASTL